MSTRLRITRGTEVVAEARLWCGVLWTWWRSDSWGITFSEAKADAQVMQEWKS